MEITVNPWELRQKYLLIAGLGLLGLIVLFSPARMVYDEVYYLPFAKHIHDNGLMAAFINNKSVTTGPGHGLYFALLYPFTQNAMPLTRIFSALTFMVGFLYLAKALRNEDRLGWQVLLAIGIPPVWLLGGLSLTEVPAIALLSITLWIITRDWTARSASLTCFWMCVAGLLSGMVIITRQPYLVLMPSLLILVWMRTRNCVSTAAFAVTMLLLPLLLFTIWGGLTSPNMQFTTEGIRWISFPLSLAHIGLAFLFIAPAYFMTHSWKFHGVILLAGLALNTMFFQTEYLPFYRIANGMLDASMMRAYGIICGGIIMGCAGSVLLCTWHHMGKRSGDHPYILYIIGCFLFALTSLKITHQFSSRYVIAALPFLVMVASRHYRAGALPFCLSALGIGIGAIQLLAHYRYS